MMAVCACVCALGAFAETTEAYVKDGLIAIWDGWENDGAGGTKIASDYTTYLNRTPPLQLGGATVHATADFTVRLDAVLTGTGGMAKVDTGTHDVTFAAGCSVSGSGGLAKTGTGTLTFAGACTFSGSLAVNDGQVAFAERSTVPASAQSGPVNR